MFQETQIISVRENKLLLSVTVTGASDVSLHLMKNVIFCHDYGEKITRYFDIIMDTEKS